MCTRDEHAAAIWCGKLHPAKTVDRLATKTARTKYKGEGICLGANVTGRGRPMPWHAPTPGVSGQVWAQAEGTGNWWVVDASGGAWIMHESSMNVTGQAADVPLFGEAVA